MTRFSGILAAIALLSGVLHGSAVVGATYRWVDENGGVHFSDQPPAGDARAVESIEVAGPDPSAANAGEDYYSVTNQVRRMQEQRLAREKARRDARLAERELALKEQAMSLQSWYAPYRSSPYATTYVFRGYNPYRRYRIPYSHSHRHHYRPHRPGLRPLGRHASVHVPKQAGTPRYSFGRR